MAFLGDPWVGHGWPYLNEGGLIQNIICLRASLHHGP